ncbi:MAG TPA: MarR family transcriptional regulator [Streptosporangiaceae bacterium]
MRAEPDWTAEIPMPGLLLAARATYGTVIRTALSDAGLGDVPRNGGYVLAAIAQPEAALQEIIARLGASKQTAGQLVDALAARGYLERSVDAGDRRRATVRLTGRGQAAVAVIRAAVGRVDAMLAAAVGAEHAEHARAALAALARADPAALRE